ncbi:MAG: methionyl-tRNA formyltransferase [Anaerolineales bacterium]
MRTVFMGSPDFAVPTLEALIREFEVIGVVTQPDRPAGRGRQLTPPPVKEVAGAYSIPVIQPKSMKRDEPVAQLSEWAPEIIVVAAFGQILPEPVLQIPRYGCLNVHASLLPRWRGAAPIQAAILQGDDETGVTIMKMDPGLDTGPILAQRAVPIHPTDSAGRLSETLASVGAELLADILPAYIAGRIVPEPQDDDGATYASMLRKADGRMNFDLPAAKLARMVHAYNPWPGAVFFWRGKRIAVHAAHAIETADLKPAGATSIHENEPAIQTSEGLLVLDKVQPAGSRPMAGSDFLNGAQDFAGDSVDPAPSPSETR